MLGDSGPVGRGIDDPLKDGFMEMMAPELASRSIAVKTGGGKHPLPFPSPPGVRVLALQGERKLDPTGTHDFQAADCCKDASAEMRAVCYRGQCLATAKAFAAKMGIPDGKWSVSFQSRLGRAKWIEPYTETRLDELGKAGVKKLLVMCPAFVADCIETLEEIGDRGKEQFIEAGGEELVLVPCLNDHPEWVRVLAGMCEKV